MSTCRSFVTGTLVSLGRLVLVVGILCVLSSATTRPHQDKTHQLHWDVIPYNEMYKTYNFTQKYLLLLGLLQYSSPMNDGILTILSKGENFHVDWAPMRNESYVLMGEEFFTYQFWFCTLFLYRNLVSLPQSASTGCWHIHISYEFIFQYDLWPAPSCHENGWVGMVGIAG